MKKPLVRVLVLLFVAGAIAAGVLAYYSSNRAADFKRYRAEATSKLEGTDLFKQDNAYFMQIFNHAQPLAERRLNGMFKPGVKESAYYVALLSEMGRKAKADGKVEVAQKLRTFGTGRGWLGVQFD